MKKISLLLLLMLFALPATAQEFRILEHGDYERTYTVQLPDNYDENTPAPVLIALHGAGSNGLNLQTHSQLDEYSNELGYISVFPDGVDSGWYFLDEDQMIVNNYADDTEFLSVLIDELSANYAVDTSRIYIAGFSNGALLAIRAGCDLANQVAGVAIAMATFSFELAQHCEDTDLTPLILIWGSADEVFQQSGYVIYNEASGFRTSFSYTQTRTYIASRYQCSAINDPVRVDTENSIYAVVREVFAGCVTEAPVVFYGVGGMGHVYPDDPEVTLLDNESVGTLEWAIFDFFEMLNAENE